MAESMFNLTNRIEAVDKVSLYLDEKGVEHTIGGYDPDTVGRHPIQPYHVPPEPSDQPCYVLECIPQKFWERVVRIGLEEIATKRNCKLGYLWREFVDHHNDDMKIVLYVVNK